MNKARPPNQARAIIFDFDGTIADSFEVFVESFEAAVGRKQHLSTRELKDFRESSLKEVIQKLKIKKWQIPRLLIRGKHEITKRMNKVKAFDGMPETIVKLSKNHTLYILSTNSEVNIRKFLDSYKLSKCITKIYANTGLQGKARNLKNLRKSEGLEVSDCIYIGDETRDIEASKKTMIKCIAVGWGYNSPKILRSYDPSAVVSKPQDLVKTIEMVEN